MVFQLHFSFKFLDNENNLTRLATEAHHTLKLQPGQQASEELFNFQMTTIKAKREPKKSKRMEESIEQEGELSPKKKKKTETPVHEKSEKVQAVKKKKSKFVAEKNPKENVTVSELANRQAKCQNSSQIEISKSMVKLYGQFVEKNEEKSNENLRSQDTKQSGLQKDMEKTEEKSSENLDKKSRSQDTQNAALQKHVKKTEEELSGNIRSQNTQQSGQPVDADKLEEKSSENLRSQDPKEELSENHNKNSRLQYIQLDSGLQKHVENTKDISREQHYNVPLTDTWRQCRGALGLIDTGLDPNLSVVRFQQPCAIPGKVI